MAEATKVPSPLRYRLEHPGLGGAGKSWRRVLVGPYNVLQERAEPLRLLQGGKIELDHQVALVVYRPTDAVVVHTGAEIVQTLARGLDTRGIASELHVSENTVQDHLKSIFDKTATRSRGALLGRARAG